jgi:SAM-dependent methyltransferase
MLMPAAPSPASDLPFADGPLAAEAFAGKAPRRHDAIAPSLDAFRRRLGEFFRVDAMLQLDWASPAAVDLVWHDLRREFPVSRRLASDEHGSRLPLKDGVAELVFNLGSLATLDDLRLSDALAELARLGAGPAWIAVEATPGRDRVWWEARCLEAGFRKHPLAQRIVPYEDIETEGGGIVLVLERLPADAALAHPLSVLKAERDLHMDMLREPGVRSDAHLARYTLARELVSPGMVVLDAACGLGYGAAILASGTDVARVIGVDCGAWAVDYARRHYSATHPATEFHACDATRLAFVADASVDLVVSFETLEHLPNPLRLLREFARVLKPGGRFIGSVPNLWIDEHGHNPVPYHLHIYDHEQFETQIAAFFDWRRLFRQNAGGGWKRPQPRILREIPSCRPTEEDCRDAEWWIAVAESPAARLPR